MHPQKPSARMYHMAHTPQAHASRSFSAKLSPKRKGESGPVRYFKSGPGLSDVAGAIRDYKEAARELGYRAPRRPKPSKPVRDPYSQPYPADVQSLLGRTGRTRRETWRLYTGSGDYSQTVRKLPAGAEGHLVDVSPMGPLRESSVTREYWVYFPSEQVFASLTVGGGLSEQDFILDPPASSEPLPTLAEYRRQVSRRAVRCDLSYLDDGRVSYMCVPALRDRHQQIQLMYLMVWYHIGERNVVAIEPGPHGFQIVYRLPHDTAYAAPQVTFIPWGDYAVFCWGEVFCVPQPEFETHWAAPSRDSGE